MHIPDGVLNPEICIASGAASVAAVGYSLRRLKEFVTGRIVPLTAMLAAFLFAAQMVNFPLPGLPVSGHLLGGVLACVILGPWAGCVALTLVLVVQCLLFADGGLLALGVNVLHIGVIGSLGSYAVFAVIRDRFQNRQQGVLVAAVITAWLSVMAAAFLFCVEFALSHSSEDFDLRKILTLMVVFHSLIGIGEALLTGLIIRFVQQQRPDFIYQSTKSSAARSATRFVVAGVLVALSVAAFVAPFASGRPDGLEAVAERTNMDALVEETPSIGLSDYEIPGLTGLGWEKTSVGVAGIGGTVVVLVMALLIGRFLPESSAPSVSSETTAL